MVRDGGVTRDEGRGIEKRISNNKQRMMNVEWQEFEDHSEVGRALHMVNNRQKTEISVNKVNDGRRMIDEGRVRREDGREGKEDRREERYKERLTKDEKQMMLNEFEAQEVEFRLPVPQIDVEAISTEANKDKGPDRVQKTAEAIVEVEEVNG